MKKIGLMGCGAVADYGHIPAILNIKNLKLQALFDPNEANLHRLQKKYSIPMAFTDADEFFSSGIDAVSITSPAPCHKQNVFDAARHKLPVICEKPLAMDRKESAAMVAVMKKARMPLYTGFCYRFSPCSLKIRELVARKAIGRVKSLRLIYNWDCHGKYENDGRGRKIVQKRRADRMLEGGPMVDCGTHQIDLAAFWLGSDIVSYHGHGAWVDSYEAPDHMWLHLDHKNGAHTTVEISYSYHFTSKERINEFVYELIGTEGVIRYDRNARTFTMRNAKGTYDLGFHHEKNFEGMYREWAKSLHTGKPGLLTTAEAGMRVTDIARNATNEAIKNRIA
ncbi:MAG: Gfo/Idh/MocA family oxidoreductase [Spirochaetes bacterium]|nr:Gfo/Idh/MocA family oxidoreductase [Spirochaetota bacterium]